MKLSEKTCNYIYLNLCEEVVDKKLKILMVVGCILLFLFHF